MGSLQDVFSFEEVKAFVERVQSEVYDPEFSYNIPLEAANAALQQIGQMEAIIPITFDVNDEMQITLSDMLPKEASDAERRDLLYRMLCKEFLFVVKKG